MTCGIATTRRSNMTKYKVVFERIEWIESKGLDDAVETAVDTVRKDEIIHIVAYRTDTDNPGILTTYPLDVTITCDSSEVT